MKYFYIAITSIFLAYFTVLLFTYFYQRNLLYHPSENNYQGDNINFNYQEIFIDVEENIKLKSWFIKKDLKNLKTIIFFHGNAGDLTNRIHKLNELNKLDVNILIISWRGFSGNLGKPTEKNLYQVRDAVDVLTSGKAFLIQSSAHARKLMFIRRNAEYSFCSETTRFSQILLHNVENMRNP